MASLTTCLKKAGEFLSADDRREITATAAAFRKDGAKAAEAARQAVEAQIAKIAAALGDAEKALEAVGKPTAQSVAATTAQADNLLGRNAADSGDAGLPKPVDAPGDAQQTVAAGDAGSDAAAGSTERAAMESQLSAVSDRVASLEMFQPSLVVRLDADGRPVTLAQEMSAIRREAANGTDDSLGAIDAGLIRVAAECALSMGL